MTDQISPQQFHDADGIEGWRVLGDGACVFFRTGSFSESVTLADAAGNEADIATVKGRD
jgi:4a-hydroxytetrahydrobiopterin dehydratase